MHGHSNTMTTEFFNDAIAINMCISLNCFTDISNMTFPWLDSFHPFIHRFFCGFNKLFSFFRYIT